MKTITAAELIQALSNLPPDRPVVADVQDIGFLDITGLDDDPSDPGARLMIPTDDMAQEVFHINKRAVR